MKLTITNLQKYKIAINQDIGVVGGAHVSSFELTIAQLEAVRPKLMELQAAGLISWVTANSTGVDDRAEGATVSLANPTFIPDPPAAHNANTTALAIYSAQEPIVEYRPTATRNINPRNAPTSMAFTVMKTSTAAFGVVIDVTTGGTTGWTTPAGLNTNYTLFNSDAAAAGSWLVRIDLPNKTVLVTPVA